MALDKGAQAVIFDVSDDADAAAEVSVRGRPEAPLQHGTPSESWHSHLCVVPFPVFFGPRSSCGRRTRSPVPWCWWSLMMQRS